MSDPAPCVFKKSRVPVVSKGVVQNKGFKILLPSFDSSVLSESPARVNRLTDVAMLICKNKSVNIAVVAVIVVVAKRRQDAVI
jgi:hypothetical protein